MVGGPVRRPKAEKPQTVSLLVEDIVADPNQPRKTFPADELRNLAKSLSETGQISPIVVRPESEGKYIIVVGERRWRAAKEAGLPHVQCIMRDDIDAQKAREMQLAENCQREDIPPLEQARSFRAYLETYNVSQRELSRRTGIPQRTISDRLALLSLPMSVHAQIEAGVIGPYEAIRISTLPAEQQEAVAGAVSSGRIGGRILEKLTKLARAAPEKPIEEVINELASAKAIPPSPSDIASFASPTPVSAANDDINSGAEIIQPEKQVRGAELEKELAKTEAPSEAGILLAIARELGGRKQKNCPELNKDRCSHWSWDSEDSIPQGAGDPVKDNQRWRVKPSPLLCALCNTWGRNLEDRLFELEYGAFHPLSGVQVDFECDCGSQYYLATLIKCTKCGREVWWGVWPED